MNLAWLVTALISCGGLATAIWANVRSVKSDRMRHVESRTADLEKRLDACEKQHTKDEQLIDQLRSENEWLRAQYVELQRRR